MTEWKPDPKVLEEIAQHLEIIEEETPQGIIFGNKTYSISELMEQIKQGTPEGREFYEDHIKLKKIINEHGGEYDQEEL